MYINAIAHYVPNKVVTNDDFLSINGLTNDWILSRTGIHERRKADPGETTNSMGLQALKQLISSIPFPAEEIDLIVGASYTPNDTIATLGHEAQKFLQVPHIPVLYLSTACSSLLNAIEVVEGYFAMNKAKKALVVVADHNTAFANLEDTKSGHLWGDGAVAFTLTKDQQTVSDLTILDLVTGGAACVGKGPEGVYLSILEQAIYMPNGRDVFLHACQYMSRVSKELMEKNGYTSEDLAYFIPHQANFRISKKVAEELDFPLEKVLSNIQHLGNTGSPGCGIALSQHWGKFQKDELIAMAVFGGGYSYGSMLIRA